MSRLITLLIALLLLGGALWFLSGRASVQPTQTMESEVTANAATK